MINRNYHLQHLIYSRPEFRTSSMYFKISAASEGEVPGPLFLTFRYFHTSGLELFLFTLLSEYDFSIFPCEAMYLQSYRLEHHTSKTASTCSHQPHTLIRVSDQPIPGIDRSDCHCRFPTVGSQGANDSHSAARCLMNSPGATRETLNSVREDCSSTALIRQWRNSLVSSAWCRITSLTVDAATAVFKIAVAHHQEILFTKTFS